MNYLELPAHCLYILSGIPASGKSTLLKRSGIPHSAILSSDQLRLQLYGEHHFQWNQQDKIAPYAFSDHIIFKIMMQMTEARIQQDLPTFIDTTAINDSIRQRWFDLAEKYNYPVQTLILDIDLDMALQRNYARSMYVPEDVICSFHQRLQLNSKSLYKIINKNIDKIKLVPRQIPNEIHANQIFTKTLIDYQLSDFSKLQKMINSNQLAILDANGLKLLKLWKSYQYHQDVSKVPQLTTFLKLDLIQQRQIINYLQQLPAYYADENTQKVYAHQKIQYDNVIYIPKETCITGLIR